MHNIKFNSTRIFSIIAIALVTSFIFSQFFTKAEAAIGINRQINFQGKLVNNPLSTNVSNTSYTVVFTLYDDPDAGQGTVLWQETQSVTTVDGIFRVALGSVTPFPANFNFNWDGLYLGIKVNADSEMTPRIQMAAVPFAFNAEKVAGLTVQDDGGNASTSGTLRVGNAKTVTFADNISFGTGTTGTISLGTGTNSLTLSTTNNTSITLPTTGTLLTNTASANQTITSTQTTGNVLSLADSTGLTGNITGLTIGLTSSTNSQNKTGISFDLSGGTGGTYYDLLGSGSTWSITRAGVLTVTSCTGCGGAPSGANWWNQLAGALSPIDTANDFLIGSTATSSSLFSYTGIQSGNTIASASGNLILMANNGWGGQLSIGTTTPTAGYDLNVAGSSIFGNQQAVGFGGNKVIYASNKTTDPSNDSFAVLGSLEANPSGGTSNIFYGGFFNVISSTGNVQNFTGRLVGFQGQVSHNGTGTLGTARGFAGFITNVNGGTITDSFAGRFGVTNAGAGQVTNAYGVYVVGGANNGGGTFLNNYGVYIEDQSRAGITQNYNIYSAGEASHNYLAGNLGVGTTAVGNGQLVVNQTNFAGVSGDIISASAAGTTKFILSNGGNLAVEGSISDLSDANLAINDGLTVSGAIAANGGITFDAATDTLGAFTMAGNIIGGSFIITDIGSTGTDFDTSGGLSITTDAAGTALTVDNAANASSIFVAEDNNTPVFTIADGGNITATGTLAVNGDSITADGATLTINAAGAVDIQDGLTVDSLTIDTGDITWSGTTPTITINAAETFTISNGTAADNFVYNTSTNALTVGDGTNGLTFDIDTGMTYQGTGRKQKTITLSPEYPGAVLSAYYGAGTDTNLTGNMTSDTDTTQGTSIRNYYQWERTTDATQHFYTVAVRVTLPKDFSTWATTNALVVNYRTESATNTVSDLDLRVYNENSATIVASSTDQASTSWTTIAIDDSVLDDNTVSEWDAADETSVIYLRMGSASSNYVQIGDIQLNYMSAF